MAKLIHNNYGYQFDCSVRGKIKVSLREWIEMQLYLSKHNKELASKLYTTLDGARLQLAKDLDRRIEKSGAYLVNIRTTATDMLVKAFASQIINARRHKRVNYIFEVELPKNFNIKHQY